MRPEFRSMVRVGKLDSLFNPSDVAVESEELVELGQSAEELTDKEAVRW